MREQPPGRTRASAADEPCGDPLLEPQDQFAASDKALERTARTFGEFGADIFLGAHRTTLELVYRFRLSLEFNRRQCSVAGVASNFDLKRGIDPRNIAR